LKSRSPDAMTRIETTVTHRAERPAAHLWFDWFHFNTCSTELRRKSTGASAKIPFRWAGAAFRDRAGFANLAKSPGTATLDL
jgi:hypothetical protein